MAVEQRGDPPLPMVEGKKVVEARVDQSTLTRRYTGRAMKTPGYEDRPGSEQRAPLVLNHAVPLVMGQEP